MNGTEKNLNECWMGLFQGVKQKQTSKLMSTKLRI